ncbi:uncharacterized protein RHOBADRAFT_54347 [Rhodotorula graminis WP1]|uniref:Deacetylase sirtuin-type domain-containing protein n=1 Tax=Rhodotorula graminis (strain WP1) TaxID=578459 RepID=A0A194S549_RHOGW|nr:uncharacterized protein RHOBADRAFT_54347 [Rhodotorula graminis WP1]KPV74541.1 hypothetical protein RHOBADRAFT_54347 [Rhodotorula graminis WP1]
MDPSELESTRVVPVPESDLAPQVDVNPFPPGGLPAVPAPLPNYQDLTDESPDDSDEDWDAVVAAAEAAFSEQDIEAMHRFLKERGLFAFLKEHLEHRAIPPSTLLLAFGVMIRHDAPLADQLRMLKVACSRVLRNRDKLDDYNTPDDVVDLVRRSKRILFLTGAGVSTSCGIPDFRSPTGLYARLQLENNYELDDPQDMFDLAYFKQKPHVFYSFAKEIYPSAFVPSPSHRFVRLLEKEDKLLRNYTQNIDGLFEQVGVERMLNCHGSFATASCLLCKRRFPGAAIEADVFASRVPLCPYCTPELEALEREKEREKAERPRKRKKVGRDEWDEGGSDGSDDEADEGRSEWDGKGLVKPDIVFFGEALSDEFDHRLLEDREEVDLVIVMGTSLRVSPVAQLPSHLPHSVPQILINRDPVAHHQFDVVLLGDGDGIVRWLCKALARAEGDSASGARAGGGKVRPGEKEGVKAERRRHGNGATAPALSPHEPAFTAAAADPSTAAVPSLPSLPASAHPPASAASTTVPERVGDSHVWLFPGANRESRWVRAVREAYGPDGEGGREGAGAVGGGSSSEDDEEDEGGEAELRRAQEGDEAPVELPASLAPGAAEGLPSDEESDAAGLSDDDDDDEGEGRRGAQV